MTTWQDIGTAKRGAWIDALCVDEDGIEVEFPHVLFVDDEAPYAFVMMNPLVTKTYWPHENGYELKGWRPSPPSKERE
jgi:hypothetical protein